MLIIGVTIREVPGEVIVIEPFGTCTDPKGPSEKEQMVASLFHAAIDLAIKRCQNPPEQPRIIKPS